MGMNLSCKEASRLISQQLDTPLPLGGRLQLKLHLLMCDACGAFRRQAAFLRAAMRRYRS